MLRVEEIFLGRVHYLLLKTKQSDMETYIQVRSYYTD